MLGNVGGQAMLFRSQTKRNTILALCFGIGIDVIVSYGIGLSVETDFPPLMVAVGLPIGVYMVAWIYSMYVGLKQMAWFLLFERQQRVDLIHSQLLELNFPPPESQFDDADDYLEQITLLHELPTKSALVAGQLIGIRYQRPFVQALCNNIVIEKAIEKYRLTRQAAKASAA
jgi:hypothetical protein